jgi:hypothetical protein
MTPAAVPVALFTVAITVTSRVWETPLVVSVLFAQRMLASLVSVAITMHPSALERASARSAVSWGELNARPPARY